MRKRKSGDVQHDEPASIVPASVDEYLAEVDEPARAMLVRMRALIRSALPPEATEIISYRMPAFKLKKVLVWFAAFSNHCSLFPTAAVIDAFKDELKGFETAKGTIHFPLDKPLPAALIKKIVKVRLQQALGSKRLSAL
jgi:uncharacterized protein YdhG (YjbR/CyaY superfamily)